VPRPLSIGLWPRNDDFDGVVMVSARSRDAKTATAGSEKFCDGWQVSQGEEPALGGNRGGSCRNTGLKVDETRAGQST